MKLRRLLLSLLLGTAAGGLLRAEDFPVATTAARDASVEAAADLLAAKSTALPADAIDPFHPAAFETAVSDAGRVGPATAQPDVAPAAGKSGNRNAHDLLVEIATSLKPGGFIVMRGTPTLSFGQKRVKAGDPITINFEGTDYTLEVVAIDRTSFTLRLNREEYTRPIK